MMNMRHNTLTGVVLSVAKAQNTCRVRIQATGQELVARYGVTNFEGTTSLLLVPQVDARCWVSKLSVEQYIIVGCDQVENTWVEANKNVNIASGEDITGTATRDTLFQSNRDTRFRLTGR